MEAALAQTFEKILKNTLTEELGRHRESVVSEVRDTVARLLSSSANPMALLPELLSLEQAGVALGGKDDPVSRRSLYRLADRDEIEFVRVGALIRVRADSIRRLIDRGYRPQTRPQLRNQKTAAVVGA
jgi:hypothetical protein